MGGVLVLISDYLVILYAADGQSALKEPKPINANRIKNAVRSLVDSVKSAMKAPARETDFAYAFAA